MDLKQKRREIREKHFSTKGLLIISFLCIIGMCMIYFSGIFSVDNYDMLYECLSENGMMIIIGSFFVIVFLYCLVLFFLNVILMPRREVLYLCKKDNGEQLFINKKGKKILYNFMCKNYEEGYYFVIKTHDYICAVLEKTHESWVPRLKRSYWLNFYTPFGNFEDIFLLPIVYVMFIPCLLSVLMSKGFDKIYGIVIGAFPFYIIFYDLIYKIKLKKSDYLNNKNFYK